jgi:uncharacterized integral membrane protein
MDENQQPHAQPQPEGEAVPAAPPTPARPRRWLGPVIFLLLIGVPVLILIFSNTDSTEVKFAWAEGNAPLWVILAITFVAGAVITRLLFWVWRTSRRRRARAEASAD